MITMIRETLKNRGLLFKIIILLLFIFIHLAKELILKRTHDTRNSSDSSLLKTFLMTKDSSHPTTPFLTGRYCLHLQSNTEIFEFTPHFMGTLKSNLHQTLFQYSIKNGVLILNTVRSDRPVNSVYEFPIIDMASSGKVRSFAIRTGPVTENCPLKGDQS